MVQVVRFLGIALLVIGAGLYVGVQTESLVHVQASAVTCAVSLSYGLPYSGTCTVAAPTTVYTRAEEPGAVAIRVDSPADVTIDGASAVDAAGNRCEATAGAGATLLIMGCPTGLQTGAAITVNFAPVPALRATFTYNAGEADAMTQAVTFAYFETPPSAPPGYGVSVSYQAGWNLVGGPAGWNLWAATRLRSALSLEPFYTYQAHDTDYEAISGDDCQGPSPCVPLPPALGVWLYLAKPTTVDFVPPGFQEPVASVSLPPAHWIMVANPDLASVSISGADSVYVYDPSSGSYFRTTTLAVGQGAWAWSAEGGTLTFTIQQPSAASAPGP
jgi:hypothetical protein